MNHLNIDYKKYQLKNGMEIILHQNNSLPLVSINLWYKVGSAFEKKGKTGLAHLFEHMMFQGSENVPEEMHFRFIQEAGGSLNGSTSFDRTNYYEKLPSNQLELALWLESDRMGFLLPALTQEKLDNQKSVVYNERLERYDNQPYGLAWELLITNLYPENHPYSWSTIGFKEDILSYTLEDVTSFFKKYYAPNNATLVVAGNFEFDSAKKLIEKYFGEFEKCNNSELLKVKPAKLDETKKIVHPDNVQLERLYLAWHSVPVFTENDAEMDIISDILTGSKNARLYKKLVFDEEIAQDVTSFQFSGKFGGHFVVIATAKPGKSIDELKNKIFDELNNLQNKEVTDFEINRSKNSIKSAFIYSLQNLDSLADQLNLYNFYLDEPNSINFDLNRYQQSDPEKIMAAAKEYFSKPFVELKIIPKK